MPLYDIDGSQLSFDSTVQFERGGIESNGALSNGTSPLYLRSKMCYKCNGKRVNLVFKTSGTINEAKIYYYSASGSFVSATNLTISDLTAKASIPSGAEYFKVAVTMSNASNINIVAFCPNEEVFNPYIINESIGSSSAFIYAVSGNACTSGRLTLPPNYTIDGNTVPLIVFVHGSGGMTTWDAVLGYAGSEADYRPYLEYLSNEGFAVFDCYPWTDKEQINTPVYSPISIPVVLQSYLAGIRYVCSRFNVDKDNVNLLCKSQGGEFGHWACVQTVFPFRTVSLFAPASISGSKSNMMYNVNTRYAVTKYTDFVGTSEEISTFVSSGNYNTASVKSFCDNNKDRLLPLMPFAHGVCNATIEDLYNLNFESLSAVPQWMLDEGLPERPSGVPIAAISAHNEYVKKSSVPVRFWGAFDDTSVSMYNNYAICRWLQNSGSDATFRVLPLNTGGHHAMDTASSALKSSGTTALGITYTDIPTAYVEVVDFIRLKCAD